MSQSLSAVPHKDPRGRRQAVGWHRAAALDLKYLQLHAQLIAEGKPMSGRIGGYVYSRFNGRLYWHRYVVPKDPRTPAQRCSRTVFRDASKVWSQNESLTEEQRDAWYAAAAKTKCAPRLGQSGVLTGQQHFVGCNSVKERWGFSLLLEPPGREAEKEQGRTQNTQFSTQVLQPQRLVRATWEPRRACTGPPPDLHREPKGCTGRRNALRVPIQMKHCQALTRASSDRPHTASRPLPVRYRWQARSPSPVRSIGLSRRSSTFPRTHRNAHFRELWRGG